MTGRSKVLAPLATVVAVGAVAVTATLVAGGGNGSRAPRVLHLANATTGTAATRDAAPASSGGAYRLTGDLPRGKPADAAAWTLPAGPGPAAPVARLADALKAGTPVREGNGWRAGGLHVTGDAGRAWYFYLCGPETPVASGAPAATDSVAGCAVSSGQGYAVPGTVSSDTASSYTGSGTVSSGTVTAEPAPASSPDASPVPRPAQQPVQKTPTKEQVRAAAAPILDAVGLADATARVTVFPGGGSAVVDPVVGALETYAWATRVDVDENGKVVGGNGWLATPEKADTYPLVTAREAFDNLPVQPRMMMTCRVTPGGGCKEPAPTEITGARLGLTVAQLADGGQLLVPAWLFDVKGSPDPVAGVAVEAKYVGSPDQPTTEPATGKPTQVDPAPPPTDPRSPLSFDSAYRAKTAKSLVVQYGDSGSCPHTHVTHAVKEDAASVVVVLEADSMDLKTVCTDDYRAMKVEVALQAPLAQRKVIDGSSGLEIAVS